MKEGDYVKCINAAHGLVEGKIYKISCISGGSFCGIDNSKGATMSQTRFEPVKVAVHCKTEDEWDKAQKKIGKLKRSWSYTRDGKAAYLDLKDGSFSDIVWWKSQGYHIISAQEYLGEPLQTNNIKGEDKMKINDSIRTVFVEEDKDDFELVEKMQDAFGTEISEDFTGVLILRAYKEKYVTEIERRDAEKAKAEKEAEKD